MGARSAFLALLLASFLVCTSVLGQPAPAYRIIVNPNNPATTLDRGFLTDAFLKKITSWPGGEVIHPADLGPDSPVRRAFTRDVMSRSVEAVKGYWQQRIFSGRDVPPPEFATDEQVVEFVLKHEGGVGYVSASAKIGDCRLVAVQ
jgi:ABC-type phosphate transport system substrate-binding protein